MVNDSLSDMLIRIKNGYLAQAVEVFMPTSKLRVAVAEVLVKENYIKEAKVDADQGLLVITLKYDHKEPAITDLRRVSKPGRRVYTSIKSLPRVLGGLGIHILSTPKGVMSQKQAKKLNVGGEVLAQVW